MNCRENDLAVVLPPGRLVACPFCAGRAVVVNPDTFVRVTQHDGVEWILEEPLVRTVDFSCGQRVFYRVRTLSDAILRPIRNPGEDERDETLEPGYVKTPREVVHG